MQVHHLRRQDPLESCVAIQQLPFASENFDNRLVKYFVRIPSARTRRDYEPVNFVEKGFALLFEGSYIKVVTSEKFVEELITWYSTNAEAKSDLISL